MAHMAAEPKVFDAVVEDETALEKMGYQQGKCAEPEQRIPEVHEFDISI